MFPRRGLARAGAGDQSFQPHQTHQPLHALAIDPATFLVQVERHSARAIERLLQVEFVDPTHQSQIGDGRLGSRPIDPRARHVEQLALPPNRQIRARPLHLRASGGGRSSTWPPGQEIPLYRQLADLAVELGRLTLARLLALAGGAGAPGEKARYIGRYCTSQTHPLPL